MCSADQQESLSVIVDDFVPREIVERSDGERCSRGDVGGSSPPSVERSSASVRADLAKATGPAGRYGLL